MARNNKSIIRQVQEQLESMRAYGQSKHADKVVNGGKPAKEKIYSFKTFDNYLNKACQFAKWAREKYGCKSLDEAHKHVSEYLLVRISEEKSAWTVRLDAAALAKLYKCAMKDFGVELPSRYRADVRQHRQHKEIGHYSYAKNRDSTDWGRGTGMRRSEMLTIRPDQVVVEDNGDTWIRNCRGKGGRIRDIPVDPKYATRVQEIAAKANLEGRKFVFERVNKYLPEHAFRAEYAQRLYDHLARPADELNRECQFTMASGRRRSEVYDCRKDRSGTHYDAVAMEIVSHALGHSRLDVVTSYIN